MCAAAPNSGNTEGPGNGSEMNSENQFIGNEQFICDDLWRIFLQKLCNIFKKAKRLFLCNLFFELSLQYVVQVFSTFLRARLFTEKPLNMT